MAIRTRIRRKTRRQIAAMRHAGRLVRAVLDRMGEILTPGVATAELNAEAERMCLAAGGECLFKGVPGHDGAPPFPAVICASLNDHVVHGIPGDRTVRDGDLVSIDFGARLDGWCADAAETFLVGHATGEARRIVEVTREALHLAIRLAKPGRMWSRVAFEMQQYVEHEGFSVVRELAGHGIGRKMWEPPTVPNFCSREARDEDFELAAGMVVAVEPMVNAGEPGVFREDDGWTIATADGRLSAHFEHTIAVTGDGAEVLTHPGAMG